MYASVALKSQWYEFFSIIILFDQLRLFMTFFVKSMYYQCINAAVTKLLLFDNHDFKI